MYEANSLMELKEQHGADARQMDIFCYFAYYPYLNA